jgi:hypothetical protein
MKVRLVKMRRVQTISREGLSFRYAKTQEPSETTRQISHYESG